MNLFIKNMVSMRCKMVVESVLDELGIHYTVVELGNVKIKEALTSDQHAHLEKTLLKYGLELKDDKKNMLIEEIKNVIIEMVHYSDEPPKINFSNYLSEKLKYNYTYLSNLFSEVKGTTVEHFIIAHKIERVKELLVYDELTLSEIAWKLHYSSVGHLSSQFKKVTGLTPSHFKKSSPKQLIPLDAV